MTTPTIQRIRAPRSPSLLCFAPFSPPSCLRAFVVKLSVPMADTQTVRSNLLIVDDEEDHAQVMCEALQRLGHRCDVTYNLAEARARLEKKTYDVIVTDLVMDGKRDGLEVLDLSQRIQDPPPPVIMVTAHGDIPTCKQ